MKKLVVPVAVVFVLFWIISNPGSASGSVNNGLTNLKSAGSNMVQFMSGVLGSGSGTGSQGSGQ